MVRVRERLKHCVVYDAYVVYSFDGGLYVAESRFAADDMQIWSRNLRELLDALDVIEDVADRFGRDPPSWLDPYLDGETEMIVLPSAQKGLDLELKRAVVAVPLEYPFDIEDDIRTVSLFHRFPSRIAREYGIFKNVA